MTNEAWARGVTQLVLAFPAKEETERVQSARMGVYRQHLDDLVDEAWLHAVAESIRFDEWFPTVGRLRKYADAWRPDALALPPARRTPEEIEQGKADARAGLELIRQRAAEVGLSLPALPVRPMPRAPQLSEEAKR